MAAVYPVVLHIDYADGIPTTGGTAMHSLAVFNKAVVDTVDAMHECGVSTVEELHGYQDANSFVEELYSLVTDLLWNDDDPDPGMDDALTIASAAQSMANVIVAEMNGAAR